MPVDLLIDGYNLLHAAGLAKARYGPGELQRRRATLLRKLADLLEPGVLSRTTVVFDARINPPPVRPDPPPGPVTVIFAPRDREADDVVEELLAKHSAPHQVLVVSSDHRLHKAARRRGASPIDSDDFLSEIEPDEQGPRGALRPQRPTAAPRAGDSSVEDQLLRRAQSIHEAPPAENPSSSPTRPTDPKDDNEFWERRIRGGDP
jgi:predicted RNA-binding protein with PIN domain